jgi:hypothetical protein
MICMNLDRRSFLLSSVAAPFVQTRKRTAERPNLVLFMTDDHGAWATGAYGAREIRTPHIDLEMLIRVHLWPKNSLSYCFFWGGRKRWTRPTGLVLAVSA